MSLCRSKPWGLDVAEFQKVMQLLGHLCMWKEQGQSSPGNPKLLDLLISRLVSGASSKTPLISGCPSCLRSQALAVTVHTGH